MIIGCHPERQILSHVDIAFRGGVGKNSGTVRVDKDSGRMHEWVSSHFITRHVGFQVRMVIFLCLKC